MVVAARQGSEKPMKIEQSKVKGRSEDPRTSGRTHSAPGWPNLHRAGPGGGKTQKKRSQRAGLSPLCVGFPSHLEDVLSCYFLNKTELQQGAVTPICLRALTVCSQSKSYNRVCPRAVTRRGLQCSLNVPFKSSL